MFGQIYVFAKMSCIYFDAAMPSIAYLFCDLIVLISITFALTLSEPLDQLSKDRPTSSLLGYHTVGSIGGYNLIYIFFYFVFFFFVSLRQYVHFR